MAAARWVSRAGGATAYFAVTIWLASTAHPSVAERGALVWALTAVALAVTLPPTVVAAAKHAWITSLPVKMTIVAADAGSGLVLAVGLFFHLQQRLPVAALVLGFAVIAGLGALRAASDKVEDSADRKSHAGAGIATAMGVAIAPALAAVLLAAPRWAHSGPLPLPRWIARLPDGLILGLGVSALAFTASAVVVAATRWPVPQSSVAPAARRYSRPHGAFAAAGLTLAAILVLQPVAVRTAMTGTASGGGPALEAAISAVAMAASLGAAVGGRLPAVAAAVPWGARRTSLGALAAGGVAAVVFGLSGSILAMAAAAFAAAASIAGARAVARASEAEEWPPMRAGRGGPDLVPTLSVLTAGTAAAWLPAEVVVAGSGALLAAWAGSDLLPRRRRGAVAEPR